MAPSLPVWWEDALEARALRTGAAKMTPCSPEAHAWKRFNAFGQLFFIICNACGRSPLEVLDLAIGKAPRE